MNRSTVFPVYGTYTISQYKDQRNEIMKGREHIRRRRRRRRKIGRAHV